MDVPTCPNCPSKYWSRIDGDLFRCGVCLNHWIHNQGRNYSLGNFRKFIRQLARKDKKGGKDAKPNSPSLPV